MKLMKMAETIRPKKLMSEREVQEEYGLSVPWLRRHRLFQDGPAYMKIGRQVRYNRQAIEEFLNSCTVETKAA